MWNWISGTNIYLHLGYYGTLGIPSPANLPPGRCGNLAWLGDDNKFYTFGGYRNGNYLNDLWVFTPDSTCNAYCFMPIAECNASYLLCPGTCTDFVNLSFNASSYQWSFFGATPDTSSVVNPTNICYANPGSYDVQLIATNANGSDTLLLTNYITVYPSPPPQSITQSGDTLFAIAGGGTYQWYFNNSIINGATDYYYVAAASGDYNVVCTDSNGCEVEAAIFNVIAGLTLTLSKGEGINLYPNPVTDIMTIHYSQDTKGIAPQGVLRTVEISVYNMLGENIQCAFDHRLLTVDCRLLPSGMYWLKVYSSEKTYRTKFIKQ